MTNFDAAKALFAQIDKNQDGSIDHNEFRNWISNNGGIISSSLESSNNGLILNNNGINQIGLNGYEASSENTFESTAGINTPYVGEGSSNELIGNTIAQINTTQQTNDYLSQTTNGIYEDPSPQIVRRAANSGPITYQQKILVRFLQPPAIPPPGPLIIKEVRPPQPPPPPPLIVRQRARPLPTPPPLILRERPPVPPASVASQTVIRHLPPVPVPPRSVIIERLPPLPPKPRDIIIERWIPYGPQPKRRTVIQRAPPAVQYSQPRNIIVVYDGVQARVIRQFQRFGVIQENPQSYMARYGSTLLDSVTLVQQARSAGVIEDISPPAVPFVSQFNSSNSFYVDAGKSTGNIDYSNTTTNQSFPVTNTIDFDRLQLIGNSETSTYGLETANNDNINYSSTSHIVGDSALAGGVGIGHTGFDMVGASFAAADVNRDGRLDQNEFRRFIQGAI